MAVDVDGVATHKLQYTIHSTSGWTVAYRPENILVDDPHDVGSRWTGAVSNGPGGSAAEESSNGAGSGSSTSASGAAAGGGGRRTLRGRQGEPARYLILELAKPALVTRIGFGKHFKSHPCNVAEMQVLGGLVAQPRHMELLHTGGLRNDSTPESFKLDVGSGAAGDPVLPVKYVCIDAIAAHSLNYNVSIWHVWLEGNDSEALMAPVLDDFHKYQESVSFHLMLSHLRRTRLLAAFDALFASLPERVTSTFEHALVTTLFRRFVIDGAYQECEAILDEALRQGLFDEWDHKRGRPGRRKGKSIGQWQCLGTNNAMAVDGDEYPEPRGGHQMVRVGRRLLLFGGWNGSRDLNDLWAYDLPREADDPPGRWQRLQPEGDVPAGRSCHQMAVDESSGDVYMLGAFIPNDAKVVAQAPDSTDDSMDVEDRPAVVRSDFWRYRSVGSSRGGRWEKLSDDTSAEGGPPLFSDHAMIVDSEDQMLYVFGGRKRFMSTDPDESRYCGMYSYSIVDRTWTLLFDDPKLAEMYDRPRLSARMGHSMLFNKATREILIVAGQRYDAYLNDAWRVQLISTRPGSERAAGRELGLPGTEREGVTITVPWRDAASTAESDTYPTVLRTSKLLPAAYDATGAARGGTSAAASPPAAFTQRVVLEPNTGEWFAFSGITKVDKEEQLLRGVWQRSADGIWSVVEIDQGGDVPPGRFAAQVVYDPLHETFYQFGGNPNDAEDPDKRLNDFWRLHITKPSPGEALRKARFLLRRQKFAEMCRTQPSIAALTYLQTSVSSVVNHHVAAEAAAFRSCMAELLSAPERHAEPSSSSSLMLSNNGNKAPDELNAMEPERQALFDARHAVFVSLCEVLHSAHVPLKDTLVELTAKRSLTRVH